MEHFSHRTREIRGRSPTFIVHEDLKLIDEPLMATSQTNHVLVTDDDHGPILAVVTWFLMTVMILAVLARVTIKLVIRRAVGVEDYLIVAALVSQLS